MCDIAVLVNQYSEEELNLREIAKIHGISHETVRRRLLSAGVRLRERQERIRIDAEEILGLRSQGLTIREIAEQYDISEQTIYRRLGGDY